MWPKERLNFPRYMKFRVIAAIFVLSRQRFWDARGLWLRRFARRVQMPVTGWPFFA
jgi:hypothetical protein